MQLSDISLWGVLPLAALAGGVLALFAVVNHSVMQRLLRVSLFFLGNMAVLGIAVWVLCWLNLWWVNVLWAVLVAVVVAVLVISKNRQPQKAQPIAVIGATLAGMLVAAGCLLLCFVHAYSTPLFVAVVALTGGHLYRSLPPTFLAFQGSLRHTKEHILYLQANGANRLEALMPSIRRGLRASVLPILGDWVQPLVVVPPMLLCGLLLTGSHPVAAICATVVCLLAALVGCVTSSVVLIWLVGLKWLKDSVRITS